MMRLHTPTVGVNEVSFEITSSSPQAMQAVKDAAEQQAKYPFDDLQVGQSFTAKLDEVNWKSLRTCVYQRNSRERANNTGVEFKFIKHDGLKLVEVARIA